MTRRLFITDFDGVICDSVLECLLVTYNAYHTLTDPSFTRVLSLDVIAPEKQRQFRQLRPYLKGAEDFVPMYLAIEAGKHINNQKDFNDLRALYEAELPTYQRAFYAERDHLLQHEKDTWLALNPLFDGLKEAFPACRSFDQVHILTTKRQQDVVEIFDYQQIPFPADHIVYMKAAGKSQKLLDMLHAHQVAFEDCMYVEDQVDFVVTSRQHGIGSYLVDWGYVSAEQQALARQHDVPIIQPRDFADLVQSLQ